MLIVFSYNSLHFTFRENVNGQRLKVRHPCMTSFKISIVWASIMLTINIIFILYWKNPIHISQPFQVLRINELTRKEKNLPPFPIEILSSEEYHIARIVEEYDLDQKVVKFCEWEWKIDKIHTAIGQQFFRPLFSILYGKTWQLFSPDRILLQILVMWYSSEDKILIEKGATFFSLRLNYSTLNTWNGCQSAIDIFVFSVLFWVI